VNRFAYYIAGLMKNLIPLIVLALAAFAQDHLRFDVASIKANPDGPQGAFSLNTSPGNRFRTRNMTVWNLIRHAYGVRTLQMAGGPEWIKTEGFDIEAKTEIPVSQEQLREMLQTLLAERFRLKIRREQRSLPAYALVVAKGGPKLQPAADSPGRNKTMLGQLVVQKMSMGELASVLESDLDRPVVDRTGITGNFAFQLEWTRERERTAADPNSTDPMRPSIFAALQEQLGLKLEATRSQIDMLVIESVERPSAN
jgi:uncharacterized protein (TIGR03435 family)